MELWKRYIWAIMLFKFKSGVKAATAAFRINRTFGEKIDSESTVLNRLACFRTGDHDLEKRPRSYRPGSVAGVLFASKRKTLRDGIEIWP